MEGLRSNCESTPALRAKSSEVPQKLPTYRKMRLKSIARISEWEVEINQGITGMRNPGIPGKSLKGTHWATRYGIISCYDFFTV